MIRYKPGVKVKGIQPEIVLAIQVAYSGYRDMYQSGDMVVTSVMDGVHSANSLHYKGLAVDLRTRDMHLGDLERWVGGIKECLTDEYDVVLERNHIHIEYQPKESYT